MPSIQRVCLAAALGVGVASAGLATAGEEPGATPKIDAAAMARMVQSFDKVEKHEFSWGWIRWIMNAELDPAAQMTLGVVEVRANQQNPAHRHDTCEEVLYILSGSCEHRVGSEVVTLKAGDVMRVPRGVAHSAKTLDEPMRAIVVYNTGRRDFKVVE